MERSRSAREVLAAFLALGLTSFGGPLAHLGYFRREFVERRGWLTDEAYAELIALCQFLPGPASSQAGFAIGLERAGLKGGIAAFIGFTAPSALLMFAAAFGLLAIPHAVADPAIHGLMLVAVAVVAHAVVSMAWSHCRTWTTALIALVATIILLMTADPWLQPVVILAGALLGLALPRQSGATPLVSNARIGKRTAIASAVFFVVLLAGLPVLAQATQSPAIDVADAFYRSGALVFGGGHVILPLLEAETVGQGWITQETFLGGYGAAQMLPGPLSSFAAFLGAASTTGLPPIAAGLLALVMIFLPGFLLVLAVLPWRDRLRASPHAAGFIRGANASVVGLLAAAFYSPVATSAILSPLDAVIAGAGFVALRVFNAPPLAVVAAVGLAGAASFALL